MKGNEDFIVFI